MRFEIRSLFDSQNIKKLITILDSSKVFCPDPVCVMAWKSYEFELLKILAYQFKVLYSSCLYESWREAEKDIKKIIIVLALAVTVPYVA